MLKNGILIHMNNVHLKCIVLLLFFVLAVNAQIKFKPPKIKKQADTTQVQQKKSFLPIKSDVASPVPIITKPYKP
jgi:hypothetical protein